MFLGPCSTLLSQHRADDRLEAGAVADRARHLAHESFEPLAAGVGVGLGVAPLEVGDGALEHRVVRALAAVAVLVAHVHLGGVAAHQRLAHLFRQRAVRGVGAEAELLAERADEPGEVLRHVRRRPRSDGALVDRLRVVGHDELGVDLHAGAEAVALRAGAERGVERERAGLELVDGERVVVGAGELLGEPPGALRVVVGQVDEVGDDEAVGQVERRLDGLGEPLLHRLLDLETVDDDVDGVLLLLGQLGRLVGEVVRLAVDEGTAEALRLQLAEQLAVLPLAPADDRRQHLEAGVGGPARGCGRRSAAASAWRSARRTRGSAAGRRGRRAGAGSRRPR